MAFNPSDLIFGSTSPLLSNTTVWKYSTADSLSDIETKPNVGGGNAMGIYFNDAAAYSTVLRPTDWIAVTASDGEGLYRIGNISTTVHTNDTNVTLDGPFAKGSSVTGSFWGT